MSYGHANCPKCGEPTSFYPEVGEDESKMLCGDCRIAELETEVERLKVCGTCTSFERGDEEGNACLAYELCDEWHNDHTLCYVVFAAHPCHFTPSRWKPYWGSA